LINILSIKGNEMICTNYNKLLILNKPNYFKLWQNLYYASQYSEHESKVLLNNHNLNVRNFCFITLTNLSDIMQFLNGRNKLIEEYVKYVLKEMDEKDALELLLSEKLNVLNERYFHHYGFINSEINIDKILKSQITYKIKIGKIVDIIVDAIKKMKEMQFIIFYSKEIDEFIDTDMLIDELKKQEKCIICEILSSKSTIEKQGNILIIDKEIVNYMTDELISLISKRLGITTREEAQSLHTVFLNNLSIILNGKLIDTLLRQKDELYILCDLANKDLLTQSVCNYLNN